MTIEQFKRATANVQNTMLKYHGILLLKRNVGPYTAKFYQLDDFYVEVVHSSKTPSIQCYTFLQIDGYISLIDISDVYSLLA